MEKNLDSRKQNIHEEMGNSQVKPERCDVCGRPIALCLCPQKDTSNL